MLSTPAPYPHPGAVAFLIPNGEPCRIRQTRKDKRLLISLTGVPTRHGDIATRASGNRTVALDEIAETAELAAEAGLRKPKHGRRK